MRAWDLIGYDGPQDIRIVGGTALYESVVYWDGQRSDKVKLARLVVEDGGLRTLVRYVDPETEVELVGEVPSWMCRVCGRPLTNHSRRCEGDGL